jgi:hypothetical protein
MNSIIFEEGHFVAPGAESGSTTAYGRMKELWLSAKPDADDEPTSMEFALTKDSMSFVFYPDNLSPQKIPVQEWGKNIRCVFLAFEASVNDLLPAGMACDDFDHTKLTDRFEMRESVFSQPQNKEQIDSAVKEIIARLMQPGEDRHHLVSSTSGQSIDQAAIDQWFLKEAKATKHALASIAVSAGSGLDSFQYKGILYESSNTELRHIFLSCGQPIIAKPLDRPFDIKFRPNLWAVPLGISNPFLFLLAVIKRIGKHLLGKIGKEIPFYDTEVFVHYKPRRRKTEPWRYNGTDADAAIRECTEQPFNLLLTSRLLRQMAKVIFSNQFSQLFAVAFRSKVDSQGQHNKLTSYIHYGRLRDIPSWLRMSVEQASLQLSVSQISQAIHRLGPVDEAWRELLVNSAIFRNQRFDGIALERARVMINTLYGVGGLNRTRTTETVKDILARQPFFCTRTVSKHYTIEF